MYGKELWNRIYEERLTPWTDKGKDASFAEQIIGDTMLDQSSKVLDYGCGEGTIGKYFLAHGLNVDFAEIAETQVEALTKELGNKSHVYQANEPKDIKEKYDIIICSCVLHHIEPGKWQDFLDQFNELLNEGGKLWISGFETSDKIYQMNHGNAPATGHTCWPIDNLSKVIENTNFEITSEYSKSIKIAAFDQPRHIRFFCLKTKNKSDKMNEHSADLVFNKQNDRVEYARRSMQELRDKRQKSVLQNTDPLAEKQEQIKTALRQNGIKPEEMGKTGQKDGTISEKNKQIADIQIAVYQALHGARNK